MRLRELCAIDRELKVQVREEGLARLTGKGEEEIAWSDVAELRKHESPKGNTTALWLKLQSGSALLFLGFEDMDGLAAAIQDRMPETSKLVVKRAKVDWQSPATAVVIVPVILAGVYGFAALQRTWWGETIMSVYSAIFVLGFGLWFSLGRPMSNAAPRLRRLEIVFGLLMLAIGVMQVVDLLLGGPAESY